MTAPINRTLNAVTIADVRYLRTTANANPVFQVTLADGRSWPTKPDANVNHQVPNFGPGATDHGVPVDVTLDPQDRILFVLPAGVQ